MRIISHYVGNLMDEKIFWNKPIETASVKSLKKLQLKLLRHQIERVYRDSKFYKARFGASGICPSQIESLEDIEKLPFTTREDLENNFKGILSVPLSQLATVRLTSGTTGKPLTIAHTRADIENIAEASARKLSYHGVTDKDSIQVAATYGLWQGAWSVHWGAERIGACVIPVGSGDTERQIRIIKQFRPTVLYGVTNYHFRIAEVARQLGENLSRYSLKIGICVAERPSEAQIAKLKEAFGYNLVAIDYGATEFPGFSVNCSTDVASHHVWSDFYLVEIVDPESHEVLGEGERGELAITSLQREAFPLIRYLSRDITVLKGFEKCECGLTHPKVSADIDREDSMMKLRGVPVFPSQIESILEQLKASAGRIQVVVDKRTPRQVATLNIETNGSLPESEQERLRTILRDQIKNRIGVTFDNVVFVPFGSYGDKIKKSIVIK
jgi:phenylacetate-CoA ligase